MVLYNTQCLGAFIIPHRFATTWEIHRFYVRNIRRLCQGHYMDNLNPRY